MRLGAVHSAHAFRVYSMSDRCLCFSCKNGSVDIWQAAAFIFNKYRLFLIRQSQGGCCWLSCFGGTESC